MTPDWSQQTSVWGASGGRGSPAPTSPLVLLKYKASWAVTETGTWGADTVTLTALSAFSTQVND